MMDLTFYKQKENTSNAKLTVQKTGRLGFSKGAIEMTGIKRNTFAKFGSDNEKNMFLVLSDKEDEFSFKVSKAGEYYYINARNLLRELDIDYKSKNTFIFDLFKTDKKNIYKMNKRVIYKE